MIKAIFTDLDGTIVPTSGRICNATKEALEALRAQGVAVIPVSGRGYRDASTICEELRWHRYGIYYGGSKIIDHLTQRSIWERLIDSTIVNEISTSAKKYNATISPEAIQSDISYPGLWIEVPLVNLDDMLNFLQRFNSIDIALNNTSHPSRMGIQVTHTRGTKYYGAKYLIDLLELGSEEVLAIGDGDNDIPLFEAAGCTIAMGNGTDTLKSKADFITDGIDQDGFAKAIKRYVF